MKPGKLKREESYCVFHEVNFEIVGLRNKLLQLKIINICDDKIKQSLALNWAFPRLCERENPLISKTA